jgi:hypothetical protein
MKDLIKKHLGSLNEALVIQSDKANNRIVVVSDKANERERNQETFKNKAALKAAHFIWKGDIGAWTIDANQFENAKKTIESINKKEMLEGRLEDLEDFVAKGGDFEGKGNLMDKLTMYIEDLSNIVDEAAMSAEIRRYLTFFAKFKGHSWNNTILIYIQRPDATQVAGFREWENKHFRRVKAGAKGIMIFAPVFNKGEAPKNSAETDKELDKEIAKGTPVRFRPVYVFDISDTTPIDERGEKPESPEWFSETEPTERTIELYEYLEEAAKDIGVNITNEPAKGGERGWAKGDHINMTSSVKGAGELATLIHEVAHTLLHYKATSIYYQGEEIRNSKPLKELQAESVAYVVMKHYDLPVQHSSTYLALWGANKDRIKANLKVISEVAKFIIQSIDTIAQATKTANKDNVSV